MKRASSKPSRGLARQAPQAALRVDRERHQRLASVLRPRERHVRDVDAARTEHRPDPPDHAGDVVVAEEDHPRRELEVDREAEGGRRRGSDAVPGQSSFRRPRSRRRRGVVQQGDHHASASRRACWISDSSNRSAAAHASMTAFCRRSTWDQRGTVGPALRATGGPTTISPVRMVVGPPARARSDSRSPSSPSSAWRRRGERLRELRSMPVLARHPGYAVASMFLVTTSMVLASCSVGWNSTSSLPSTSVGVCPGGA